MDVMPAMDPLVNVCVQFYTGKAISEAKQLLFASVPPNMRHIVRRGDNKPKADMSDIIKVFLQAELKETPIFTAQCLANLPLMSVDCMDSLQVRTDLETLKQQVMILSTNQKDMFELMQKTVPSKGQEHIQDKVSDTLQPEHQNKDQKQVATASQVAGRPAGVCDADGEEKEPLVTEIVPAVSTHNQYEVLSDQYAQRAFDTRVFHSKTRNQHVTSPVARQHNKPYSRPQGSTRNETGNQSRKEGVVFGTAPSTQLKAAQCSHESRKQGGNRICSGVFVTLLDPRTTVKRLAANVKLHTGYIVKPEKLPQRYDMYSSFYIRCDKN
jgi:hypothetical protein